MRLSKLERRGLCHGPQCCPGRSWALSQAGKAHAATALPLIDGLDRELLVAVALSPLSLMALKRRIEVCRLTVRRRVDRLIERGFLGQTEGSLCDFRSRQSGPRRPVSFSVASPRGDQRRAGHPRRRPDTGPIRRCTYPTARGLFARPPDA